MPKKVTKADLESATKNLKGADTNIQTANENLPAAGTDVDKNHPSVTPLRDARDQISSALNDLGGKPCGGGRPCG